MSLGSMGSKGCARLGGSDSSFRWRAIVVRGGRLENRTYRKERHNIRRVGASEGGVNVDGDVDSSPR